MQMSRPTEAKTALMRAVENDQDLAEARYNLGFALSALGDYQGALRETKLALELDPYIPAPRFRLLIDLQFEEASVLAPELDVAQRVSGAEAGIETFEFEPAALDAVFHGEPAAAAESAQEFLASARAALERGELEGATADAQRAAMLGGDRVEVLLLQGQIYLRRGLSGMKDGGS